MNRDNSETTVEVELLSETDNEWYFRAVVPEGAERHVSVIVDRRLNRRETLCRATVDGGAPRPFILFAMPPPNWGWRMEDERDYPYEGPRGRFSSATSALMDGAIPRILGRKSRDVR